jgi:hypothetical protein
VDGNRRQAAGFVAEEEDRVDERVGVEVLSAAGQGGDVEDVGRHLARPSHPKGS